MVCDIAMRALWMATAALVSMADRRVKLGKADKVLVRERVTSHDEHDLCGNR